MLRSLSFPTRPFPLLLVALGFSAGCEPDNNAPPKTPPTQKEIVEAIRGDSSSPPPKTPSNQTTAVTPNEANRKRFIESISSTESNPESDRLTVASQEVKPASKPILSETAAKDSVVAKPPREDDPSPPWINKSQLPSDAWEMTYLSERPVGYSHRHVRMNPGIEGDVVQIELTSETRVSLEGEVSMQRLNLTTYEKPNGELLRIEGSLEHGDTRNSFRGTVKENTLKLETRANDRVSETSLPWFDEYRGPFAIEQSLLRRPLEENEVRILRHLDPMLGQLVETRLESQKTERTPTLLNGTVELRRVSVVQREKEKAIESILWTDAKGVTLKTTFPGLNMRAFRVEEKATVDFTRISTLVTAPKVNISEKLLGDAASDLEDRMRVAYSQTFKVNNTDQDPFISVSRKSTQALKSIDARTAEVIVYRSVDPKETIRGIDREQTPPREALAETEWVDASNPNWNSFVESLMQGRDAKEMKAQDQAALLRDALRDEWTTLPFDRQIRKVESFLRSKRSNGVERALLLASVYRTMKIPSRLALGYRLELKKDEALWSPDAWVEYFDGSVWRSIDPAATDLDMSPNRLKISESYFEDTQLLEEMAKVLQWGKNAAIAILP